MQAFCISQIRIVFVDHVDVLMYLAVEEGRELEMEEFACQAKILQGLSALGLLRVRKPGYQVAQK